MKELSLLLESSTEPTIHNMLDYFLRLLYERLETSPKDMLQLAPCTKLSWTRLERKLLILWDDVEQFFMWVVAVMSDGRRIGFDWLIVCGITSVNGRTSPSRKEVYTI